MTSKVLVVPVVLVGLAGVVTTETAEGKVEASVPKPRARTR